MSVSVDAVKELRALSGAGIMDCKKALTECQGDVQAAVDWLRKKGLSTAQKKSGRTTAEGLVAVAVAGTHGVLVEVNCETDFVARNEQFVSFAETLAQLALQKTDVANVAALLTQPFDGKSTVQARLQDLVAVIGENMSVRRLARVRCAQHGTVSSYLHNAVGKKSGRIGVLVALEHPASLNAADVGSVAEFGQKLAMHVAANRPLALNVEALDPAVVKKERAILIEQAQDSGKPAAVIEKMIDGRMRKFFEEVTFLSQPFVMNPDLSVQATVDELAKSLKNTLKVGGFAFLAAGEGVEKEVTDFAKEVASAAGQ